MILHTQYNTKSSVQSQVCILLNNEHSLRTNRNKSRSDGREIKTDRMANENPREVLRRTPKGPSNQGGECGEATGLRRRQKRAREERLVATQHTHKQHCSKQLEGTPPIRRFTPSIRRLDCSQAVCCLGPQLLPSTYCLGPQLNGMMPPIWSGQIF